MSRLVQHKGIAALLLSALLLSGCGPRELSKKETYPVKGKIVRQGEPVRFANVSFKTTEPPIHEAVGRTDEDGTFELRTYSNAEPDGAPAGHYQLTVSPHNLESGALPADAKPTKLPPEATAPLPQTFEVKEEDNDLGTIELP
jgi:hypothetical protein